MTNSKYVYQVLTQDEQDEIMVSFIHGQERDLYCHMLSQERYREMLRTLPEGDWRKHIAKMEKEVTDRLAQVQSIIDATTPQLPSAEWIAAAKARLAEKAAKGA